MRIEMGIRAEDLINYIVKPVLTDLSMYSKSAEQLVSGTIAHESLMGTYLHQLNGPAKGIIQMEKDTHNDIYMNYLNYHKDIKGKLYKICNIVLSEKEIPSSTVLIFNLRYAVAMCRIAYYRHKEELPDAYDIEGFARYWKKYYNTSSGKGTVDEFIHNWNKFLWRYYS